MMPPKNASGNQAPQSATYPLRHETVGVLKGDEWIARGVPEMLSVVMPAHNEAENLPDTIQALHQALLADGQQFEILVVNDNSSDDTPAVLAAMMKDLPELQFVDNSPPNGYGHAVRKGLESFRGDSVIIVMADGSDDPKDVVAFHHKLREGYDCVFGSRFIREGRLVDYPFHKLIMNRMGNLFIQMLFWLPYNDVTNAFKCYRRHVIAGLHPLLSHHFNLTVELPLKALVRGYSYTVLPNAWYNRKKGISKLLIREMGSRYLFIILYCFLEKWLSRGDYRR
ncbi:MAG: glycosyltransferase family 2 protein [Magnetococcales bacterium]|nr:glycosyltransferase family 2 protein [Magnetococcales bacterium]